MKNLIQLSSIELELLVKKRMDELNLNEYECRKRLLEKYQLNDLKPINN